MTIHEVAAQMPEPSRLLDRCRAVTMIDSIQRTPDGYSFVSSGCSRAAGRVLRLPNVGTRSLDVHFHGAAGVLVYGWDVDADFVPMVGDEVEGVWGDIVAQVPDGLRLCLWEADGTDLFPDDLPASLSALMWRLPSDTEWQTARFEYPEGYAADASATLFQDLTHPAPDRLTWGGGAIDDVLVLNGEWVEPSTVEAARTGLSREDAIRHVMGLRPLTEQVVRTLNPHRGVADVIDDIAAVGYPHHG